MDNPNIFNIKVEITFRENLRDEVASSANNREIEKVMSTRVVCLDFGVIIHRNFQTSKVLIGNSALVRNELKTIVEVRILLLENV